MRDHAERLAGSVMMVGFEGEETPEQLREFVAQAPPAGLVLFRRNLVSTVQIKRLMGALRGLWAEGASTPLLAVDQEGGRVARLRPCNCPAIAEAPSAGSLASAGDLGGTRQAGRDTGELLASLGFNLDFAPVLDVDSNPQNPIIGDRAFGSDPETVIAHAIAWAHGLATANVLACGKHFPGHGDTDQDSHLTLPHLPHDLQRLERLELRPFGAAVAAGMEAIMSAHIIFDALDDQWPATLSATVIPSLLRDRMGFDGVVFSDDLEMAAIDAHHDAETIARKGLLAGLDVFLVCRRLERAREIRGAIADAAMGSEDMMGRLEAASARVSRLRERAADHARLRLS
jgi:beta-N-acetylhexosaminidase